MKKVRLIELFAGYGSQAMALRNIGIDFEHYKVVEFDKFAIDSYNAVHGTNFPVTDIRDIHGSDLEIVDTNRFTYLLTYSFPCTDLSVAGKMQGMSRDSGTRSGLLWEVERLLKETDNLPHFLLMENVTQVHGSDNIKDFAEWISFLDSKGYRSKWADLNAKDYGIPQNRSRCFMVSWLDPDFHFEFPTPIGCDKTMQDYLEDDVDAKYYLSGDKVDQLIDQLVELGIEREREYRLITSDSDRQGNIDNNCQIRCGHQESSARSNGYSRKNQSRMCGYLNYNSIDRINTQTAMTITTDCKSFGTGFQPRNGVIEWE